MSEIGYINAVNAYNKTAAKSESAGIDARDNPNEASFGNFVEDAMQKVVDTQEKSEKVSADAIMGKASAIDVMQAVDSAESTLNLFVSLRDRMVQAYEKIARMPV